MQHAAPYGGHTYLLSNNMRFVALSTNSLKTVPMNTHFSHKFDKHDGRREHIVEREFSRAVVPRERVVVVVEALHADHPNSYVLTRVQWPEQKQKLQF